MRSGGGHVFGTWSERKRQTNERENVRLVGENYKYLAAYDVKTRTLTLINVLHSSKLLVRLSNLDTFKRVNEAANSDLNPIKMLNCCTCSLYTKG